METLRPGEVKHVPEGPEPESEGLATGPACLTSRLYDYPPRFSSPVRGGSFLLLCMRKSSMSTQLCCLSMAKSLHPSEPQFPPLENGHTIVPTHDVLLCAFAEEMLSPWTSRAGLLDFGWALSNINLFNAVLL